jgi:hypothetical protein
MKKILSCLVFLLAACSNPSGDEYLGDWRQVKYPAQKAKITRNGNDFIVARNMGFNKSMLEKFRPLPAKLKDGELIIGGIEPVTIIKSSGNLIIGASEYERDKP